MSQATVGGLFSPYITEDVSRRFAAVAVEHIEISRADMRLRADVRFDHFEPYESVRALELALQEGLQLRHVELVPHYPSDTLSDDCFPTLVRCRRGFDPRY